MIIGLCGYAQSGKDSIADYLTRHRGFYRLAFADALKGLALDTNPWIATASGHRRLADIVADIGWEFAKRNPEVRQFLQDLGVGVRNRIGDDTWLGVVQRGEPWYSRLVITDVRFPNEAEWIKQVGLLVRVERPGVGPVNGHVSESAIAHIMPDAIVQNDGTLDQLHDRVRRLMDQLEAW